MTVKIVNETVGYLFNLLILRPADVFQPFNIDIWLNIAGGVKCKFSSNATLLHNVIEVTLHYRLGQQCRAGQGDGAPSGLCVVRSECQRYADTEHPRIFASDR